METGGKFAQNVRNRKKGYGNARNGKENCVKRYKLKENVYKTTETESKVMQNNNNNKIKKLCKTNENSCVEQQNKKKSYKIK